MDRRARPVQVLRRRPSPAPAARRRAPAPARRRRRRPVAWWAAARARARGVHAPGCRRGACAGLPADRAVPRTCLRCRRVQRRTRPVRQGGRATPRRQASPPARMPEPRLGRRQPVHRGSRAVAALRHRRVGEPPRARRPARPGAVRWRRKRPRMRFPAQACAGVPADAQVHLWTPRLPPRRCWRAGAQPLPRALAAARTRCRPWHA